MIVALEQRHESFFFVDAAGTRMRRGDGQSGGVPAVQRRQRVEIAHHEESQGSDALSARIGRQVLHDSLGFQLSLHGVMGVQMHHAHVDIESEQRPVRGGAGEQAVVLPGDVDVQ